MYTSFFGLRSDPFGMTPDPGCLFVTLQHREAFAGLAYAVLNRRGFGVLTGDAGTGKTTLVAKVLASMSRSKVQSSSIFHPTLSSDDFLEMILLDFGITDIPQSKAQRLTRLHSFLLESHQKGKISALIIDEAHKLSPRLLEEVRLLGNFDYTDQKLLQILLVGQTELDDLLEQERLRQLKQRVAIRLRLQPLADSEVAAFIQYRWKQAGGAGPTPFTDEALHEIAHKTRGYPRVINAVCDNSLLLAFAANSRQVELGHVRQALEELQIGTARMRLTPPVIRKSGSVPAEVPAPPAAVPSPIRVPEFQTNSSGSFLTRLASKFIGAL